MLFEGLEERRLLATWSGDIPNGTVWSNNEVQRIVGTVRIPAGATLTVEPGTIVKTNVLSGLSIHVEGTLIADGTADQPIVFTSYRDDTGLDGILNTPDDQDSNGDGPSNGNNGEWNNISFLSRSFGNILDHVQVRFGGAGSLGAVVVGVDGVDGVVLTNSIIRNSSSSGMRLQTSNPTLTSNTFKDNSGAAISMDLASNPAITGAIVTNNGTNALVPDAGTLVGNGFWDDADIVYRPAGSVTVPVGSTLTVGAGQIVKFRAFGGTGASDSLLVDGKLLADGTAAQPIIFTSDLDDSVGGDTRNDGTTNGANGDWNVIQLRSGSAGHLLDNVQIKFGGHGTSMAALAASVPMTLTNSVVRNSSSSGVRLQTSNSTLTSNTFKNNTAAAIRMDLASNPTISGVVVTNNGTNALVPDAGTLIGNGFWDDADIVYRPAGNVTVPLGSTLTVGAGQIVKFRAFPGTGALDGLLVDGTLLAHGTAAQPIFFTSDLDDSVGGDTRNDGSTSGGNGDWNAIQLRGGSTGHVLDNVQIRFGGFGSLGALVASVPMTLTNGVVRNSSSSGVRLQTSNSTLTSNTFMNNTAAAISMDLASDPAISGVVATNNGANALVLDAGTLIGNGFWDDADIVYRPAGNVTVPAGSTLTVGSGQIVKFRAFAGTGANDSLLVDGKLLANGTAAQRIIFTSDLDDSVGGDTRNDGSTSGGNGDWNAIQLRSGSSGHRLENVEIKFGGSGSPAAVVASVPMFMANSVVRKSSSAGIRLQTSDSTLVSNSFSENTGPAISMDLASNPAIRRVVVSNNGINAIVPDAGNLAQDGFWDDADIVYLLTGNVTVPVGRTLTVGAGQIVKIRAFPGTGVSSNLLVDGSLVAKGTATQPILFTSDLDDSVGGDTRSDGVTSGGVGDWSSIQLRSGSTGNVLDNVHIRFGGGGQAATLIASAPMSFTDSTIRNSASAGLRVQGATASVSNSSFEDNRGVAISLNTNGDVGGVGITASGNATNAIVVDAGTLAANHSWTGRDISYQLAGNVTISTGVTLSLAADTVFEAAESVSLLGSGTISNAGTLLKSLGTSTATIAPHVVNTGKVKVLSGTLALAGGVTNDENGVISGPIGSTLSIGKSLAGDTTNRASFAPLASVQFNGTGTSAAPQFFEALSSDLGMVGSGFERNLAFYSLALTNNTYVKLVDQANNAPGNGAEAVYTHHLAVPVGTTLDLNGLRLYARSTQISGTVTGGTISLIPDGGPLGLDNVTPGRISAIGEIDDWTLFGRTGQTLTVTVSTGTAGTTPPAAPTLNFVQVELYDPDNKLLGTAISLASGIDVALAGIALPKDGTYHIKVKAPAAQASSTGNYVITAWNATVNVAPLELGRTVNGTIDTPFRIDRWNFSATAGQAVKFNLVNSETSAIQFDLTGPNGFTAFSNASSSSADIVLPSSGTYSLTVHSSQRQTGAYAFRINQTTSTELTLGTPLNVNLAGAAQSRLFRLSVPQTQQLLISLTDNTSTDRNEIYLKFGEVPTRADFQYRSTARASANQKVGVPSAAPGDWYILVYTEAASSTSTFTLLGQTSSVFVNAVTPERSGNGAEMQLTLQGLGFDNGSTVSLVPASGPGITANASRFDTPTQITATFAAGAVPAGTYNVRVTRSSGQAATLSNAFTATQGGQGILKTQVITPKVVGYHGTAEIIVEYSNTGTLAMPAPLIVLAPEQSGRQGAILTLDRSLLTQGFWTSAQPAGFSHKISLLGSGSTPGVLQPGETIRVPVYYAGWQMPWDSTYPSIDFRLDVLTTTATAPFDWAGKKDSLKPSFVSADAWEAIYANLVAQTGPSYGDVVQMLNRNAAYLASLGETVNDVTELMTFAFEQANNLSPFGKSTNVIDASVPAPGLPLMFTRNYEQLISSRYTLGPLGRGWTWGEGWSNTLAVGSDGTVVISELAGKTRTFKPDSRGGYFGQLGERARLLAQGAGVFVVQEENGFKTRYRADGKIESVEDANGNRISATYTGGRVTRLTHSSGQLLTLTYNGAGRISSVTDQVGRQTTYQYDASNEHLVRVLESDGGMTEYTYSLGNGAPREHAMTSIAYQDGTHVFLSYDNQGRVSEVHGDGNSQRSTFSYGPAGTIRLTDGLGATATTYLNSRGLVAKVDDPLHRIVQTAYDALNHPTQIVDPDGQITRFEYDARGHMNRVTDPLGRTTSYAYATGSAKPRAITNPSGSTYALAYDATDNFTKLTLPDGSSRSLTRDTLGNPQTSTNSRSQTLQNTLDTSGRVLNQQLSDGSQVAYTYDVRGNLATATSGAGMVALSYDATDQLTAIAYPGGQSLAYTYDAAGRRASLTDQTGFKVNYLYDASGNLARLTNAVDANIVQYTYDAMNRISRADNANGTSASYAYNAAGELLSLVNRGPGDVVQSRSDYSYDNRGRRIGLSTQDGSWAYALDNSGQMTQATFTSTNPALSNQSQQFSHDASGNRTSTTINGSKTTYQVNNRGEYTDAGSNVYTYDPDGNLTSIASGAGASNFTYDPRGRLVAATTPAGTVSYQYDALGNRASETRNGQTTRFVNDPLTASRVVGQYDGSGALQTHTVYGLGLASQTAADNSTSYFGFDGSGNTTTVTGVNGAISNQYGYHPWGDPMYGTGMGINPFQFLGQFGVIGSGINTGLLDPFHSPLGPMGAPFSPADVFNAGASLPGLGVIAAGLDFMINGTAGNITIGLGDRAGLAGLLDSYLSYVASPTWVNNLAALEYANAGLQTGVIGGVFDYLGNQIMNHRGFNPLNEIDYWAYNGTQALSQLANATGFAIGIQGLVATGATFATTSLLGLASGAIAAGLAGYSAGGYVNDTLIHGTVGQYWGIDRAVDGFFDCVVDIWNCSSGGGSSNPVGSQDPNDKIGPSGFGTSAFTTLDSVFPYRINFENHPSATAPAQRVAISDRLSSDLDWNTFQLTALGFGDTLITIPPGNQYYQTTVPVSFNGQTFDVQIEVGLRSQTGEFFASFQSIDPRTELPPDILTGFLPAEDGTGRGQGYVSYIIRPKSNLPTGTAIRNVALITFDFNESIATNQIDPLVPSKGTDPAKEALVTIDAGAPTSSVVSLPQTSGRQIKLIWSGSDDANGSGIVSYDVFVSDNNGPFVAFVIGSTSTTASFTGSDGHHYAFYSIATDGVGNREAAPLQADASTIVSIPLWQNPGTSSSARFDVTNDRFVTPLDVLTIINDLNKNGGRALPTNGSQQPPPFFDVNGDGFISPLDALLVINFINQKIAGGEGELSQPVAGKSTGKTQVTDDLMANGVWLEELFPDQVSLRKRMRFAFELTTYLSHVPSDDGCWR